MVLYNCSTEFGFHRYFLWIDPVYFLSPFCNSPSFGIRVHSKFIAGRLVPYIPSMILDIIKLEDADIKVLCEMLGQVSTSEKFEVHCFECVFSAVELVAGIRSILHHDLNRKKLLCNDILTSLVAILVGGGVLEKKEVCLAIWDLAADETFTETLNSVELPIIDILMELESDFDTEFNLLLSGLACSLPSQGKFQYEYLHYYLILNSSPGANLCPEACYKYGHYGWCIEQCDKIIESTGINNHDDLKVQSTNLLRAKCLYHIY